MCFLAFVSLAQKCNYRDMVTELAWPHGPALTRGELCCVMPVFAKPGSMREALLPDAGLKLLSE